MEDESAPANSNHPWPKEDMLELVDRMNTQIPANDNLPYRSRSEKLDWNKIAFKNYTSEVCKKIWAFVQVNMRRHRVLKEVLQDVKDTTITSLLQGQQKNKAKPQLRMPRRPLSVFMLFFLEHKARVMAENPGIPTTEVSKKVGEIYRSLPPEEMQKYQQMAADERRDYEVKLTQFYLSYFDEMRNSGGITDAVKQQLTPFELFYIDKLKKLPSNFMEDHTDFRMQCLKQWKKLSTNKKKVWIKKVQIRKPLSVNRSVPIIPKKVVKSKKGRLLLTRSGKPKRPPNSAYSLFSTIMLQNSEIKKHLAKNRLKVIAKMWQSLSEDDKKLYRDRVSIMMKNYKTDNEASAQVTSAPQEQQEQSQLDIKLELKNEPVEELVVEPAVEAMVQPVMEPAEPPVSGFMLFSTMCDGTVPAATLWESLTDVEKNEFNDKVKLLKQEYIKQYEQYLRKLTPEKLLEYCRSRQKDKFVKVENGCESESSCDCDDDCCGQLSAV